MRIEQVDNLKGIGILLVMFGHTALPDFMKELIYGFHMPLFFICSGFLFKRKSLHESIKSDLKKIMVPWMFFSVCLIMSAIILGVVTHSYSLLQLDPLNEDSYCLYHTIWFLVCLFWVRTIYQVIANACNNKQILLICMMMMGGEIGWLLGRYKVEVPFFVDTALSMLIFYHVGVLFRTSEADKRLYGKWLPILLLTMYILFVVIIHPHVNIKNNEFPFYLLMLSIIPTYALYQICCWLHSDLLADLGKYSLIIMGLHHPIYDVVMYPLMSKVHLPYIFVSLLMIVLTLPIILLVRKILLKFAPCLIGY